MKLNFSKLFSKTKSSPILLIGIGVVAVAILSVMWLNRGDSNVNSAIEIYKSGDVSRALDLFAEARDKNQINTAEEWNLYGNVYRDSKHLPEAIEAYKEAIKRDSGYEAAYRNLAYVSVDLAEEEKTDERIRQAIGIVEKGRKSHSKSVLLVEDLIMLYGKVGDSAKVSELTAIRTELLK